MAADVWASGVTVLELFLGRNLVLPAGETQSYTRLRQAICDGEPPLVPESAAASAELREFVAACLKKDPRRRSCSRTRSSRTATSRSCTRALRELIVETLEE
ncbi:mitogen-activated protein kinase kinase 9-like [Phragmites australis]|uniref:mitogen-activated protein kinase kinase 9-like n=1 Tax=Phragmites australis TaxID=29695 RepID=UPI002D767E4E|nr:mitogen-activated protein kinase kinase 9-like [Phragmites australis]